MSTDVIPVGDVSTAVAVSLIGCVALWNFDVAARVYLLWTREQHPAAFDECIMASLRRMRSLSPFLAWEAVEQFVEVTEIEKIRINEKLRITEGYVVPRFLKA